jgi:hypothetical protein
MIVRQLYNLNYFLVYSTLLLFAALPLFGPSVGPLIGIGIPVIVALALVYLLRLVPLYPRRERRLGFYLSHGIIALANAVVIISIAVPLLWSSLENNPDLLILLFGAIAALGVAIPVWILGMLVGWLCGSRRPHKVISADAEVLTHPT